MTLFTISIFIFIIAVIRQLLAMHSFFKYLEEKHPSREFQLIMGSDGLKTFHKWKNADLIAQKYQRLIYPRPGSDSTNFPDLPNAKWVDAPLMEISSSSIRKAIREGKDVRHLMPQKAYQYMRDMHFYEK